MSRKTCDCYAQNHPLINNCTTCGRITCQLEGEGPCLFCGNPVMKRGEVLLDDSQFPDIESKTAYAKAIQHKEKLLDFHRKDVHQSNIIDDQADYYQIVEDVWQDESIRQQAIEKIMKQQDAEQNETMKQVFDIQSMQFTLEKDTSVLNNDQYRDDAQNLLKAALKVEKQHSKNLDNDCQIIYDEVVKDLQKGKKEQPFKPTTCRVQFSDEYFQDFQKELMKVETQELPEDQYDTEFYKLDTGAMCLSMHQPWASLVVHGFKRIEGRMWPTKYKGPLWIHAGAKQPEPELISAIEHQYTVLYKNCQNRPQFPARYPTGALIGIVDMVGYVKAVDYDNLVAKEFQEEGDTEYKFVFRNPRQLMYPISMRGSNNIFSLDNEIKQIAMKSLRRVATSWAPYLVNADQVSVEKLPDNQEKQEENIMEQLQEQFLVSKISQPAQEVKQEVKQQQQIKEEIQIKEEVQIKKELNDSVFEKQVEWGILISNVLKKDQIVRVANYLATKIKKQNQKNNNKQTFLAKNNLPCHDIITNSIESITGNMDLYDNCIVHYLKLSDKKIQIQNATALLLIGQSMEIMYNNQMIQLQQGKVLIVEQGYQVTAQFGGETIDNVLKDISQDYVYKSWLIQLQQQ